MWRERTRSVYCVNVVLSNVTRIPELLTSLLTVTETHRSKGWIVLYFHLRGDKRVVWQECSPLFRYYTKYCLDLIKVDVSNSFHVCVNTSELKGKYNSLWNLQLKACYFLEQVIWNAKSQTHIKPIPSIGLTFFSTLYWLELTERSNR